MTSLLRPLHPETSLISSKLDYFSRLSTDDLMLSLQVGQKDLLKARSDGTILEWSSPNRNFAAEGPEC